MLKTQICVARPQCVNFSFPRSPTISDSITNSVRIARIVTDTPVVSTSNSLYCDCGLSKSPCKLNGTARRITRIIHKRELCPDALSIPGQ